MLQLNGFAPIPLGSGPSMRRSSRHTTGLRLAVCGLTAALFAVALTLCPRPFSDAADGPFVPSALALVGVVAVLNFAAVTVVARALRRRHERSLRLVTHAADALREKPTP